MCLTTSPSLCVCARAYVCVRLTTSPHLCLNSPYLYLSSCLWTRTRACVCSISKCVTFSISQSVPSSLDISLPPFIYLFSLSSTIKLPSVTCSFNLIFYLAQFYVRYSSQLKKKKPRQSHVSVKSCRNQISLDVIWPRIGSGGGRISWVAHSGNPQPTATWTACTTAGTPTARTPTAGTPTAVCLVISTAVWQWEQQSLWQLSPVRQLYCFM